MDVEVKVVQDQPTNDGKVPAPMGQITIGLQVEKPDEAVVVVDGV